ncbi:TPA: HNH endonuclease [Stenotrophomonas maltophilia]|uniref:HNH endonuclease n=1 Tax=Stenotrophomonas maltophilia TaxID=40324 RepID=A0AAI9CHX3_STEMA|nr:HNH endonuclease [Stenotrophomonas maltophilia]EKZ1925786.1 HNH endonuclease [Stenotrophomonas maltophilia]EMB2744823.1 HNH endonuclease [Stenotrophomonas maltophilia]MBH1684907.1 HNH endonuclease [Stenotrophomonas maltophilia]MBH1815055.1 HNH endonuclease [Stenotrophomonas maltophilia]MBH1821785.1 HNH endonuclease [Stenotrophomonas maltophilia]
MVRKSHPNARRPWTADEDETLRLNWPRFPAFLIAHVLERPIAAVYRRAATLGLKKADDFHTQPLAALWNGTQEPGSIAARFTPGTTPPNKGLRRPGWHAGRMRETQFKKGRPASEAHNYVPIGTEKVDPKRRALMRKVTDDPAIFPTQRWRPVHVLVWEAANGPVPEGHIVVFRPGLKTLVAAEITADRLETVTLAENMRRNSYHNRFPPELKELVHLKARITRRVRRRIKEQEDEEQGQ